MTFKSVKYEPLEPENDELLKGRRSYSKIVFTAVLAIFQFVVIAVFALLYSYSTPSSPKILFRRPKAAENLQCSLVLDGRHEEYAKALASDRLTYTDPKNESDLPMDCASIYARHRFSTLFPNEEEESFPIAISRTVYRDYFYHELILAALYQPQNYYCYSIDGKADKLFRKRFESLAKCFPNVFVSKNTKPLRSSGYNIDHANVACMNLLREEGRDWRYLLVLQNHDFPTKTNREIVQILKWLNGTNDIRVIDGFQHRIDHSLSWDLNSFPFFKRDSKLKKKFENSTLEMRFVKGDNEMAITRDAVEFIFNEINVTALVDRVNRRDVFGVDEMVFPSLLTMAELGVPGHYDTKCVSKHEMNPYVTRYSNFGNKKECDSKMFRHGICIYGIEEVRQHVYNTPYININKLLPSFDFGAVVCQLEGLYNRTFLGQKDGTTLDQSWYQNLPHASFYH